MQSFVYTAQAARIVFGAGRTAELPAEVDRLGSRKAFVLTTPTQRSAGEQLVTLLGARAAGLFDGAVMHTPTDVTMRALEEARAAQADCLVAIGGGSTIGLGKALALRTGLPQIVIPTTYAGSEVTPILGETADGQKKTQRGPEILPEVVIYDVEQTLGLSARMSAASALNAMAHAAEALYARDANPIVSLMAEEGIRALAASLPTVASAPTRVEAREMALYGAWLCGTCLGAVGMSLHHKLCHVLGGTFDLPHAETHAIVLPNALAYNAKAVPDAVRRVGHALGGTEPAWVQLHALSERLGLPTGLRDIGMPEEGLERALALVLQDSYWNPRPMEEPALRAVLRNAWEGGVPCPTTLRD